MKQNARKNRVRRIRAKVSGTQGRPRASVQRTLRAMRIQFIDDVAGITLVSLSTKSDNEKNKTEQAHELGARAAELLKEKGIDKIVFDRSGYLYHGRVKAAAEALRESGIKF